MADYPPDLRYSDQSQWVRVSGDIATIGITDYAQRQLGEIVAVELPKPGGQFDAGQAFGTVESVKAVIEMFMPTSGTINEVNEALDDDPSQLNEDPYGKGWMVKTKSPSTNELARLMSSEEYATHVASADA
jgi:glycine cleavage system H protein